MKQILYYTHNALDEKILRVVQRHILRSGLPIISVSHQPIDFGCNVLYNGEPSIFSMYKQILMGLRHCTADTIFFCEHDVLYHESHFDFDLPDREQFHYNTNVWRWWFPHDKAVTWEGVRSLSGLCCDLELALRHFEFRVKFLADRGGKWENKFGFEPGTKRRRRGGISDETHLDWKSAYPNIDIRHSGCLTPRKCHPSSFKHLPDMSTWRETKLRRIDGWDIETFKTITR